MKNKHENQDKVFQKEKMMFYLINEFHSPLVHGYHTSEKTSLLHCVQLKYPIRLTLEMNMAEFLLKSTILIWI